MKEFSTSREWLSQEINKRKKVNPSFSLRAFAQKTGVSSARISEYLSNKRPITKRAVRKISNALCFSPEFEEEIIHLLELEKEKSIHKSDSKKHILTADIFHLIADWQYLALLNLIKTKDFQFCVKWISNRLNISIVETELTLERLFRLGLIQKSGDSIIRTYSNLKTETDIENRALRLSHKQSLNQAINMIDECSIELRDVTSMTMAINTKNIKKAKKVIQKFRHELCELLEEGEPDEVYNLNVQLVPVTKLKGE